MFFAFSVISSHRSVTEFGPTGNTTARLLDNFRGTSNDLVIDPEPCMSANVY